MRTIYNRRDQSLEKSQQRVRPPVFRRAIAFGLAALLTATPRLLAANSTLTLNSNATGIGAGGAWTPANPPGITNDGVFGSSSATGTSGTPLYCNDGVGLTVGSFDDLHTGASTYICNRGNNYNSSITFGGSGNLGNGVSGTASDLVYVAGAASTTLSLYSGNTKALNFALGQSGSFNIGGLSQLNLGTVGSTSSNFDLSTYTLTNTGAGTTTIGSKVTGSGAITNSGSGFLTLNNANNDYSGGTTITGGTVTVANGGALGSGDVSLSTSALQLVLNDGVTISNNLTLADGLGKSGNGYVYGPSSGTATINGAITVTGKPTNGSLFATAGGTLNVGGGNHVRLDADHRSGRHCRLFQCVQQLFQPRRQQRHGPDRGE